MKKPSVENSIDVIESSGSLEKFDYVELIELYTDLEQWVDIMNKRLAEVRTEIVNRIDKNLIPTKKK
jgi:hypothetical protein